MRNKDVVFSSFAKKEKRNPNLSHFSFFLSLSQFNVTNNARLVHSAYCMLLNSINENIKANSNKTATPMPVPAIIEACSFKNSVVTLWHPLMCKVRGEGASMQGLRWPPYASWQHDSGITPYQSRYESIPQHFNLVWVSSQANVTARRLPYNASDECISKRICCATLPRNTKPKIPPTNMTTNTRNTMTMYCFKVEEGTEY